MPVLYPGGELTYLRLYGQLQSLGLSHGRDFRRRNGGAMGWYYQLSDAAYETWVASRTFPDPARVEDAPEPTLRQPVPPPHAEADPAREELPEQTEPAPRKTGGKNGGGARRAPRKER